MPTFRTYNILLFRNTKLRFRVSIVSIRYYFEAIYEGLVSKEISSIIRIDYNRSYLEDNERKR